MAADIAQAFQVRRTESLASLVRKELERMIVAGELRAGDRLNEQALAERLGVSRGPVREACRALEQDRLLAVVVNRGTYVREIGLGEAMEIYDLRSALFALAGQTLAKIITDEQIRRLSELVDAMGRAAQSIDVYYPLNVEFHAALVEFAGNTRLTATYRSLSRELHLFRRRGLVTEGSIETSLREHRAILAALVARDAERASALMRDHILSGKARLFKLVETEAGSLPMADLPPRGQRKKRPRAAAGT